MKHRRTTNADVSAALRAFGLLAQRTPREEAEERMHRAKQRMTATAQAVLDGDPDAAHLGDTARAELDAAREDLQRFGAEEGTPTC